MQAKFVLSLPTAALVTNMRKLKTVTSKFSILLCCLFLLHSKLLAQDTVINITSAMFDESVHQANISSLDGWVYKAGNDTAWAAKELNTSDWSKRNPSTLTVKDLNSSGKVEGWFRIKIKITDSLNGPFYGIRMSTWAANDVYINGQLIFSTGNTGANGLPLKEFNYINQLAQPTHLKAGEEYIIALHFVDEPSPFDSKVLKSQINASLSILVRIAGTEYNPSTLETIKVNKIFNAAWVSICLVISFLLTLLYFQNPGEKNLRLIAITSIVYFLTMLSNYFYDDFNFLFTYLRIQFFSISLTALVILVTIIIVRLFNRKINIALKVCLILITLNNILGIFIEDSTNTVGATLSLLLLLLLMFILFYYIFSSWKKLKGAQWAIVAGVIISLMSGLLVNSLDMYTNFFGQSWLLYYILVSSFSLSFPLALLVYVAMRFKEIINEVRENANKVVQLSEEKEQQALNQKKLLEEEVDRQTIELRNSIETLRATQNQLVQSEKMASLGELTAGIAHEIQNPLNFINNFSEINKELLAEMEEEIAKGKFEEVKAIGKSVTENEEKIYQHGKRADAIVKGMLLHSRKSTGLKEPTDINAVCDEYLRLSYHGLRAKDKSFNANLKTEFDESIGKANIVPQEIGRVLMNLLTNAFYAVNEKAIAKRQLAAEDSYKPTVSISTKKINNNIEIKVSDNGNGIPQHIIDKIFHPFFTTKPTGQGTGLGLSLSYDIIKAHGGELKVNTIDGEGSVFIFKLPV